MKKCRSCQKEIDAKATKCPYCQSKQGNWAQRHPILSAIIAILVLFVVIGSFSPRTTTSKDESNSSAKISETSATTSPQPTASDTPTTVPVGKQTADVAHFSDGILEVGKDIQPGTYRTREGASGCYYSRLRGFGGGIDDIISNENTDAPAVVTILPSDKGFKSERCGTWTKDLSAITASKVSFDDGIYIVNTDIEPGKYKNSSSTGCYYSRLSDFGGTIGGIISNENTDSTAIVTIAKTDKGFKSARCGTWTKM